MLATLAQTVFVRSALQRGLLAYLKAVIDLPDRLAPPYFEGRPLEEMYVQPDVFKEKPAGRDDRDRPRRQLSAQSAQEEKDALGRFAFDGKEDRRQRVRWPREQRRLRRAAIIGLPGSGKTLLCQMTAREVAKESFDLLDAFACDVHELPVPIFLRLSDVARLKGLAAAAGEQARQLLEHTGLAREDPGAWNRVVEHVAAMVTSPHAVLFLDALDEVPDPGQLKPALEPLRQRKGKVIVTSRPYGYSPGYLPFRIETEYELAPLMPRQRRELVTRWFSRDESRRQRVLELVQGNPQFGDLTRNALLLTLTCAVSQRHVLDPKTTRRIDLYRLILRDMVRGVWKHEANPDFPWHENDPRVDVLLDVLEATAWRLFETDPRRRDFPAGELIRHLRATGDSSPQWITQTLEHLDDVGLLVAPAPGRRMFVHRSFHDVLAAEFVVRQSDPVAIVKDYLWRPDEKDPTILRWQPAAAEMICFTGAILEDPQPLLQAILQEHEQRPDYFVTMLRLAGQALGDLPAKVQEGETGTNLVTGLVAMLLGRTVLGMAEKDWAPSLSIRGAIAALMRALWEEKSDIVRRDAASALGVLGDAAALPPLLTAFREDKSWLVRRSVARALGVLGDEVALSPLLTALPEDESEDVRCNAAESLAALGDTAAVAPLIRALREEKDESVRGTAAHALGALGDSAALVPLITALREGNEWWVRWSAARALGALGDEAALDPLLTALLEEKDENVRRSAAFALGALGDAAALVPLLKALWENADERVRGDAAYALGTLGGTAALPPLLTAMREEKSGWVRASAAGALGALGDASAMVPVVTVLREDEHGGVREHAARALAALGDAAAVAPLLTALREDENDPVRAYAATALGALGDAGALVPLITALREDEKYWVRAYAATALGALGDAGALVPLITALREDENKDVREHAASALGALGDEAAAAPLLTALREDKNKYVRGSAAAALFKIAKLTGRWILPMR